MKPEWVGVFGKLREEWKGVGKEGRNVWKIKPVISHTFKQCCYIKHYFGGRVSFPKEASFHSQAIFQLDQVGSEQCLT